LPAVAATGADPALEGTYDRFSDTTMLQIGRIEIGERFTVTPDIEFKGRKRPRVSDVRFGFLFTSISSDWRFLTDHDFAIIADGKRIGFPAPKHNGEVWSGGEGAEVYESMFVDMSAATFTRIANSKTIEGRLGRTEFRLAPDTIAALRELALCMRPGGFERCAALVKDK
jgi:hypothetical protein